MFGTKPAFGTTSTFGTTTGVSGFGTSAFGGQSQASTVFGASKPTVSFGQPSTLATGVGGSLFGPATTTVSSAFGGTSLFGQPSTSTAAFGATNPTTSFFGNTSGTSAFQPNTSLPSGGGYSFGSTGGSLFSGAGAQQSAGSTGLFGASMAPTGATTLFSTGAQSSGTVIKFNPLIGNDQMMKNSLQTTVQTRHQCISAMKEYESKSLEELRAEDYAVNRKGPQQQQGLFGAQPQTSTGLFGAPTTTTSALSLFGSTAKSFSAAPSFGGTNTFGTTSTNFSQQQAGGLFGGQQQQQQQTSLFGATKPSFGQAATQQPTSGLFGTTATTGANTFGGTGATFAFGNQPTTGAFGTTGGSIFGQPAVSQPLFGGANAFQTGTNVQAGAFSGGFAPSTSLFSTPAQPTMSTGSIFGNQLGSTSTGLFGSVAQTNGLKLNQLGATASNQQKPSFGTTPFGQAPGGFSQPFGASGGLFGTQNAGAFGTTGLLGNQFKQPSFNMFGTSTAPSFGSALTANLSNQSFGLGSDPAALAAQPSLLQAQLAGLSHSPYGDGALLKLLKGKRDGIPSPTDPAYQKQLLNSSLSTTSFNAKPLPPARPSPRILTLNGGLNLSGLAREKKSLFDDLESDVVVFKEGFIPKRNVKKLVLDRTISKNDKRAPTSLNTSNSLFPSDADAVTSASRQTSVSSTDRSRVVQPLNFDSPFLAGQVTDNGSFLNASQQDVISCKDHDDRFDNPIVSAATVTPIARPLTRRPISREDKLSQSRQSSFSSAVDAAESPTGDATDSYVQHPTFVVDATNVVSSNIRRAPEFGSINSNSVGKERSSKTPQFVTTLSGIQNLQDDISMATSDDANQSANGLIGGYIAGIACQRPEYYTVPSLEQLADLVDDRGRCVVDGFTVGRTNYGSIFWPDTINVANLNLDQLVFFQHKEVTVYPDDGDKPPVGYGLNRRAEVTLERVWPNDKTTHQPIKDPKRLDAMRYPERLERAASKMNAKFRSYDPETGAWVFQVPHFSKYGLGEDAEEDEDSLIEDGALRVDRKIFRVSVVSPPPPATPELSSKIVSAVTVSSTAQILQPKHNLTLLPYEKSLLFGREKYFADSSCFNNRRFRVGWTSVRKFIGRFYAESKTEKDPARLSVFRNVPRLDLTPSRDFSLLLQEPSEDSEISTNVIKSLLITQYACSKLETRSKCPNFVPENGVKSIDDYITSMSEEQSLHGSTEIDFFLKVFRLCQSLWGKCDEPFTNGNYTEDMARKNNLTKWLCDISKEKVDAEVKHCKQKGKDCLVEAILSLLTCRRFVEASQLAFENGDVRLAILLGQLSGPEKVKALLRQQLLQWYDSQADNYIDNARLKVFCLLAGLLRWKCSSKGIINLCDELDWYRCFGLHMWYSCHSFCTISDALNAYDSNWVAFDNANATTMPPYPNYIQSDEMRGSHGPIVKEDICYRLIKLFSDPTSGLETVLNTDTWTSNPLAYHLSWHLWCILTALGFINTSNERKRQLHLEYAAQLERNGLWPWAMFVLMHIVDDKIRENAVKRLLSLYVPSAEEDDLDFIRSHLKIPPSWIFEAKALKAHHDGNKRDEAWYQMKAENWNVAHTLFLLDAGPSAIKDEDKKTLQLFLSELLPHSDEIQNWSNGGQIYFDYCSLVAKYDRMKLNKTVTSEELNDMRPFVLSIATRLKTLACSTPLQKLCQSEMAFRIAALLRVVLSDEKYLEYSEVVAELPMPDDYLLEELQHVVDVAIIIFDKTLLQK